LLKRAGKAKWTGLPFIALIVLVILVPAPPGISNAVAMGIFGTVFCLGHLIFLFPDFGSEK